MKRAGVVVFGGIAFLALFAPAVAGAETGEEGRGWIVVGPSVTRMFPGSPGPSLERPPGSVYEKADLIAAEHGVSAKLIRSIIRAESNGDPAAVSPKGAMGLMQLMPETAKEQQVSNPFDPAANLRGGVRYLKTLLQEFSGELTLALAAYNAGPGVVRKYGGIPPFPETKEFVRKVTEGYSKESADLRAESSQSLPAKTAPAPLPGKLFFSGSPKDLAAFLKRAR